MPHIRTAKGKRVLLFDPRDLYEANANVGARRLREAIFAVLPPLFVDEAIDIARTTLVEGGGRSLAQRVADAIDAFDGLGVDTPRLEAKLGRPPAQWTPHDVATLSTVFGSLKRGEVTRDDEFPDRRIRAEDLIPTPPPEGNTDAPA